MRIRQVRQEFWTDELLAQFPDQVRLFYIGLWCVADDQGWFRWDVSRIGALLYPYRPKRRREKDIETWGAALADARRVILHGCGCAEIPALPRHQVVGGKKSRGEYERHLTHRGKDVPGSPESPGGRVGNVTVGNVTVDARERDEGEPGGLKERLGPLSGMLAPLPARRVS